MSSKVSLIIATGLFLALFSVAPAPAPAVDDYVNPDLGSAISTPATPPPAAAATINPEQKETIPGEKLSLKQINTILRTTRNLSGKNLSGQNLVGVDLSVCSLKGADMRNANLERADMSGSNLERADLSGANLRMASFFQAALTAANLDRAILDGAIWIDKSVCGPGSVGKCVENSVKPVQPGETCIPKRPGEVVEAEKPRDVEQ